MNGCPKLSPACISQPSSGRCSTGLPLSSRKVHNSHYGKREEGTMTKHVLFIQGAGLGAYDEDQQLAESLRRALGPRFEIRYPSMPNEDDAPYEQWRQQIEQELAAVPGPVVIV